MKQNLRVLMVAPSPPPFGGITHWYELIKDYSNKTNIHIDSIDSSPRKSKRTIVYRIFVQGINMFSLNSVLRKKLSNDNYSAVHICTSGSLALIRDYIMLRTSKKMQTKSVYHIHYGRIPNLYKSNSLEWKLVLKNICLSNDTIVMDKQTYEVLITKVPHHKIHYIPNPVNCNAIIPDDNKKKYILFAGSVIKEKGIEELLEAWNMIKGDYYDYELRIVGTYLPEYYDYLISKFDMNRVQFKGQLNHKALIEEMKKCALFVLPSYTEGCPNVVLEAMACKKAIIATNVGDIPDLLSENCGVIIEPKNVIDLKEHIISLLSNPHKCDFMANNAYKKVRNKHNINDIFDKYLGVWTKC